MTMPGRALRVVLIGPLPPPSGGMANQTRQLAELLRSEQVSVTIVQVNAPYRPSWVGRLGGVRALFRLLPYLRTLWVAAHDADVFHVMANSGWSWHLYAAPAVWIAKMRGVPAVINYRGGEAETFFSKSWFWVAPTMRRAISVIVPSGFLSEVFSRFGIAANVVPNIIDTERFCPAVKSSTMNEPHLVVARNLEEIYDVENALRAFSIVRERYPNARLSIAGTGPLRESLGALAESLGFGSSVCFTGRLERDQMAALYRDADVMLNPTRVDNMPNSVLEALASGVPVVSTNVGGIPYIVRDRETAMLVPPRHPQAMADAALEVLDKPVLRAHLIESGLAEVKRYTWYAVKDQLFSEYRFALAQMDQ